MRIRKVQIARRDQCGQCGDAIQWWKLVPEGSVTFRDFTARFKLCYRCTAEHFAILRSRTGRLRDLAAKGARQ